MTRSHEAGYRDRPVVVAGAGLAGAAAADALLRLGARVTVTDRTRTDRAGRLVARGASFRPDLQAPPRETSQVVASPGFRPDHPLLTAAAAAGIEVIGDVELAWRLRPATGSG